MASVIEMVTEMEEKTKEKLVDALKKDERDGMGVYEFVNVMSVMERQTKAKKVGEGRRGDG